jgi:hypothetical protein
MRSSAMAPSYDADKDRCAKPTQHSQWWVGKRQGRFANSIEHRVGIAYCIIAVIPWPHVVESCRPSSMLRTLICLTTEE